jgi:tetratricopeptide (TPR) repeat protein
MAEKSLEEAIKLRTSDRPKEAISILKELLKATPNDPEINYQMAWTCDFMGRESEAVPYYENAIANGLKVDRSGAMLGLGSTYRCLGEYNKSLKVLD